MPYSEWRKYKWYDFVFKRIHYSRLAMQTGVGGVLYPPHSLDETMLDPERFMALAPTTDDVWFWAAAVSKGTYVVPVPNGHSRAKEVGKPKEYSLKTINLKPGDDRNRDALRPPPGASLLSDSGRLVSPALSEQPDQAAAVDPEIMPPHCSPCFNFVAD